MVKEVETFAKKNDQAFDEEEVRKTIEKRLRNSSREVTFSLTDTNRQIF